MRTRQVYPRIGRVTKKAYLAAVASSVAEARAKKRETTTEFAERLGCAKDTVVYAEAGEHALGAVHLLNLGLECGEAAIDQVLALIGARAVPLGTYCDGDPLPPVAASLHKLTVAVSPDSVDGTDISDCECLGMEAELDAAIEHLTALKERCIAIRVSQSITKHGAGQ